MTLRPHRGLCGVVLRENRRFKIGGRWRLIRVEHRGNDPWTVRPGRDLTIALHVEIGEVFRIADVLHLFHPAQRGHAFGSVECGFGSVLAEKLTAELTLEVE